MTIFRKTLSATASRTAGVIGRCLILLALIWLGAGAINDHAAQAAGFTGIWKGTIRVFPCTALMMGSGRCEAVNKITFSLVQNDSELSGHYHCAIGTQICRNGNADTSGRITSGVINGNYVRIFVTVSADASNCDYNGYSPAPGKLQGAYSCYNGGQLVEQGSWQVKREGE